MRIVFFGTPAFSCPFLQTLFEDNFFEIAAVVTQPDKPNGRGNKITPSPVKMLAIKNNIPVLSPESLKRDQDALKFLSGLKSDAFVVVAYGKLLPSDILRVPKLGVINLHPSLLPKYRGPSPMQWAIKEGDAETGVSIMILDEGMDTGPILASENVHLDDDETYSSLENKIIKIGTELLCGTLKKHFFGKTKPLPQNEKFATLTRMLNREDGHVDWNETVSQIERKQRAFEIWPGLWSFWLKNNGTKIRIKFISIQISNIRAELKNGEVFVENGKMYVRASDGCFEILKLQPENRPVMEAKNFLAGHDDIAGSILI